MKRFNVAFLAIAANSPLLIDVRILFYVFVWFFVSFTPPIRAFHSYQVDQCIFFLEQHLLIWRLLVPAVLVNLHVCNANPYRRRTSRTTKTSKSSGSSSPDFSDGRTPLKDGSISDTAPGRDDNPDTAPGPDENPVVRVWSFTKYHY